MRLAFALWLLLLFHLPAHAADGWKAYDGVAPDRTRVALFVPRESGSKRSGRTVIEVTARDGTLTEYVVVSAWTRAWLATRGGDAVTLVVEPGGRGALLSSGGRTLSLSGAWHAQRPRR